MALTPTIVEERVSKNLSAVKDAYTAKEEIWQAFCAKSPSMTHEKRNIVFFTWNGRETLFHFVKNFHYRRFIFLVKMQPSIFLIDLCIVMQWNTAHIYGCCNCEETVFPSDCYSLPPNSSSGVYKIQPLPNIEPIEAYCEMAIHGGGFTFLPRSLTRRPHADLIVRAVFRDKKNVLLKLQKKADRSESYTLIQPHPSFCNSDFGLLVNSFSGYTTPQNAFMKEYIFLGIISASAARSNSYQGFKSNGHTIQFRNCDKNPNSLFAFMPNHNLQTPSGYHPNLVYESTGVAVSWRSKAIPITNPDRMMPNEFFFLTELHFGGCGCYTSSNRWTKYGFHATAIGVR